MNAPMTRAGLLTLEDLHCMARQGAPKGLREDLVQADGCGKVIFTIRGIQYYRHALAHFGIDLKLASVRTEADVHRLHKDLGAAAFSEQVALLDGRLDADQSACRSALDVIAHAAERLGQPS